MASCLAAAAVGPNPMIGLPLLGAALSILDKFLADFGLPLWIAEFIELVVLAALLYAIVKFVLYWFIPWLANVLAGSAIWVIELLRSTLLLPELAATRALVRFGQRPGAIVYSYGQGVLSAADGLASATRHALPVVARVRAVPRTVLKLTLVASFLLWNNYSCTAPGVPGECVSPTGHWTTITAAWFDEQNSETP